MGDGTFEMATGSRDRITMAWRSKDFQMSQHFLCRTFCPIIFPLLSHIIPYYPILSHIIPLLSHYYPIIIPYYPYPIIIPYYPIIIPYYPTVGSLGAGVFEGGLQCFKRLRMSSNFGRFRSSSDMACWKIS